MLGSDAMCSRVFPFAALCAFGALSFASSARAADPAPAPSSTLEAGGLKPPTAITSDTSTPPSTVEQKLDQADKGDSGRGLEFVWLNVEAGAETLGLETFKANHLVDSSFVHSKQTGFVYGGGLGVRLLVFTLGARVRVGNFSDYRLWTLDLEGGMHVPLGRIEPYFTFGGGYASLGSFDTTTLGASLKSADLAAKGLNLRGSFGLDVYLTDTFSAGANLAGDVLFLSRSGAGAAAIPQTSAAAVYARDGSGIGMGGTLTAVLGLHF